MRIRRIVQVRQTRYTIVGEYRGLVDIHRGRCDGKELNGLAPGPYAQEITMRVGMISYDFYVYLQR